MRDIDFSAFRADLVADAVRQPTLDWLHAQAWARRRRRLVLSLLPVLTASMMASLVVGTVGGDPAPPSARTPNVVDIVFFDPATAVAVQAHINCAYSFSTTNDGGGQWTPWRSPVRIPDPAEPPAADPQLCRDSGFPYFAFDARTFYADIDGQRYLSRDAGLTWSPWDPAPVHVDTVPPDLDLRALDCGLCLPGGRLQAMNRAGKLVELALPPGVRSSQTVRTTEDGAIWVHGLDPELRATMSHSTDRGRTWRTRTLPEHVSIAALAPRSGTEAYAVTIWQPADNLNDTSAFRVQLSHTADGVTWTDQQAPELASLAGGPIPAATVTAGGLLVVADNGEHARVWVGGVAGLAESPAPGGGSYYFKGVGSSRHVLWRLDTDAAYLTTDARDWRHIPLPTD